MKETSFYLDSTSAISITKNHVLHSMTRHIEVEYHFIREHAQDGDADIQYLPTDQQLGDILTKTLGEGIQTLGMTWALCPNLLR